MHFPEAAKQQHIKSKCPPYRCAHTEKLSNIEKWDRCAFSIEQKWRTPITATSQIRKKEGAVML